MKLHCRRKMGIAVPTTSMGDIAFLLIIFFMVCSNFAKEASITYEPPLAVDVDSVENAPTSVVLDAEGDLYLNGKRVADVAAVESMIESFLVGKTTNEERMVLFKCDRGIEKRVFEPVLEAITRAGGLLVAVGDKREEN